MSQRKIFRRDRVDKALDKIFEYPLTILCATMGYGKTTSVRNYFENRDIRMVWVSLLGCDGEELAFWNKLCVSVERIYPGVGYHLKDLGFPKDAEQLIEVMDYIWSFNDGQAKVVVIDDFHYANHNKMLGNMIEIITEEEIPNLHIVLISRNRPLFNHMNLFSKGLCYYLNTELLAFNQQEIISYLRFMEYSASKEEIDMLNHYSNGWITAIYLLLLGLKQGDPITEVSYITQLVDKNLFSSFDDATKQILLKLSILDGFTMPQAIQILGDTQVPEMIERLMNQNAFIEYDRQTGLYKLHAVLLDFLRNKFNDEEERKYMCHRAGQWYFVQEDFVRAIDYYHRAGEIEALLEQMNQVKYMRSGYLGVSRIYEVYREIPEILYVKYPYPLMHFALCFAISKDKHMVFESKQILDILEDYYSNELGHDKVNQDQILGEIEVVRIFLVINDVRQMVEHANRASQLLHGEVSRIVFRDDPFTFGIPHFLYSYYREAGMLKETIECIRTGFPPDVFDGSGTGCELVAMAEYALETGDFHQAEILADQAEYKAGLADQVCIQINSNFTKIRLSLVQGEYDKAKEILLMMRKYLNNYKLIVNEQGRVIYKTTIDLCEGYLFGCIQEAELIPEWLRNGEMPTTVLMMRGMAFPWIIYGKAVMLSKNWTKLEVLCDKLKEECLIFHNQLGILHNMIYEACAKYNLYGMEAGLTILVPALQEASLDNIILPFAEHCDFVLPMLYELHKQNSIDSSYLMKVINLCEQYKNNLNGVKERNHILTERETQVLVLLSQGMTQREIANKLYFSVSTVKKHLESIYRKLDVNNKISAVRIAQQNKII